MKWQTVTSAINSKIKIDKFLLIIFLLALTVRLGLIWCQPHITPYLGMITPIENAARNLVEGHGYAVGNEQLTPYYILPPGSSILIAGTYWIFGDYSLIYPRVVQAIIDSFGCLLIFLIGRELFGRRVGLLSAFLYSIWLPIAYLSTWPLHDALMPFFTLLCLYFFVMGAIRNDIKFYILSGVFAGVSCYFQPSTLLLPLFFGLGLLLYNLYRFNFKENLVDVLKNTALMVLALVLLVTPWMVRNYQVAGGFVGMRPGIWSGMWEGFGEFGENPVGAQFSDEATYELARKELGYDIEYLSPGYQAFFKTKALKAMTEHPGWYIGLLARRVPRSIVYTSELGINCILRDADSWNPTITELIVTVKNGTLWEVAKSHPHSTIYIVLYYLFAIAPVLLSIFGIWVVRKKWRALALILTITVYFALVHIVLFTASYKSKVPGSLAYIILSAIALDYFYSMIKERVNPDSESAV